MKTILFAAVIAVLSATAQARIGETKEQCIKRYGEPIDDGSDSAKASFKKNGVSIWVSFSAEGKCHYIKYVAPLPPKVADAWAWTAAETYGLLRKNFDGRWVFEKTDRDDPLEWHSEDGWLYATLASKGRSLVITTREWGHPPTAGPRPDLTDF